MEGRNGSDPAAAFEQYASEADGRLAAELENMRALLDAEADLEEQIQTERSRGDVGMAKLVQREWRYGHARRNGGPPSR